MTLNPRTCGLKPSSSLACLQVWWRVAWVICVGGSLALVEYLISLIVDRWTYHYTLTVPLY